MTYYRVKPENDNFPLIHNGKHKGILVGNELFTEKELCKKNILFCQGIRFNMFERIEIPKSKIFRFFGARFQEGTGISLPF